MVDNKAKEDKTTVSAEKREPTEDEVRLKNPGGVVKIVPAKNVVKFRLFKNGYRRIKGENYPDEVNESWKAFKEFQESRGFLVADADPGDTGQVDNKNDNNRRAGTGNKKQARGSRGEVVDNNRVEKAAEAQNRLDEALKAKSEDEAENSDKETDENSKKDGKNNKSK